MNDWLIIAAVLTYLCPGAYLAAFYSENYMGSYTWWKGHLVMYTWPIAGLWFLYKEFTYRKLGPEQTEYHVFTQEGMIPINSNDIKTVYNIIKSRIDLKENENEYY